MTVRIGLADEGNAYARADLSPDMGQVAAYRRQVDLDPCPWIRIHTFYCDELAPAYASLPISLTDGEIEKLLHNFHRPFG